MKILTEEEAFARLSAQCATAEHCAHEINEKMVRWQLGDDIRKRIIQRLAEERYIDERRYCRAFTADKLRYNKWGRHKIAQALAMKHIDRTLVNEALNGIDEEEYFSVLQDVLSAKRKSIKAANDYELHGKLMRFAIGRGFGMDEVRRYIEQND